MEKIWCITIMLLYIGNVQAQIKRQYLDSKNTSRTVVIKEEEADDFKILEEQFSNATMGQVIRITTTPEKEPKVKKVTEKKERAEVVRPKPVKKEKVEVVRAKPQKKEKLPPPTRPELPKKPKKKPYKYISPSERVHGPPPPKTYKKKVRWKPVKRKRINKRKSSSCFHF